MKRLYKSDVYSVFRYIVPLIVMVLIMLYDIVSPYLELESVYLKIDDSHFSRYENKKVFNDKTPQNIDIIERVYSIEEYNKVSSRLNIDKLFAIPDDVQIYYVPSKKFIEKNKLDLNDGIINIREDRDMIYGDIYWELEDTSVKNIYKYDDKRITEIVSYANAEEYSAKFDQYHKEEREKLANALKNYEGKRNWNDVKEAIKIIHDYGRFHILDDGIVVPSVYFTIYYDERVIYKNNALRENYIFDRSDRYSSYSADLIKIYKQLNPSKKHNITFEYGSDGGIDGMYIKYYLKDFYLFRGWY